jgi:hypothetical protein
MWPSFGAPESFPPPPSPICSVQYFYFTLIVLVTEFKLWTWVSWNFWSQLISSSMQTYEQSFSLHLHLKLQTQKIIIWDANLPCSRVHWVLHKVVPFFGTSASCWCFQLILDQLCCAYGIQYQTMWCHFSDLWCFFQKLMLPTDFRPVYVVHTVYSTVQCGAIFQIFNASCKTDASNWS